MNIPKQIKNMQKSNVQIIGFPALLVLIGMVTFIPQTFACECTDSTIQQRTDSADVIFSGKLHSDTWEFSDHKIAGNFAVKKIWKGAEDFPQVKTGDITVVTRKDAGLCGVRFVPNNDYLIFAKIDQDVLQTSTCSGSWFLDGRADYVRYLDEMGSTHAFVDAKEIKGTKLECGGAGFTTKEQCESDKLFHEVLLPIIVVFPIAGVSAFVIWKKLK